jgi:hypothetical protein
LNAISSKVFGIGASRLVEVEGGYVEGLSVGIAVADKQFRTGHILLRLWRRGRSMGRDVERQEGAFVTSLITIQVDNTCCEEGRNHLLLRSLLSEHSLQGILQRLFYLWAKNIPVPLSRSHFDL